MNQLFHSVLAAIFEIAIVQVLENQARGERTDDRRKPDPAREIGEQKAEAQARGEQNAARTQMGFEGEESSREKHTEHERADEERGGFEDRDSDVTDGECLTG